MARTPDPNNATPRDENGHTSSTACSRNIFGSNDPPASRVLLGDTTGKKPEDILRMLAKLA